MGGGGYTSKLAWYKFIIWPVELANVNACYNIEKSLPGFLLPRLTYQKRKMCSQELRSFAGNHNFRNGRGKQNYSCVSKTWGFLALVEILMWKAVGCFYNTVYCFPHPSTMGKGMIFARIPFWSPFACGCNVSSLLGQTFCCAFLFCLNLHLVFERDTTDQALIRTGFMSIVTSIPPPVAVLYNVHDIWGSFLPCKVNKWIVLNNTTIVQTIRYRQKYFV